MAEHGPAMHMFLASVGSTLSQCQAFEDFLRQYKLFAFDYTAKTTFQERLDLLARSRNRDTLGVLLRDLAGKVKIEARTKALLDEFLADRNWFIHHLFFEHALAPFDVDALGPLLQRMRDVQRRSTHLQDEFLKLTVACAEKRGISQAEIDSTARLALDKAIKPPV